MNTPIKVAILGGGITGLSLAFFLQKRYGSNIELTLFEGQNKLGGFVQTAEIDGFLFETGPRSLRSEVSEETLELCKELGLEKELIVADTNAKHRFLFLNGQLQKIPSDPVSFALNPLTRPAFNAMLKEGFVPKGLETDESIASFFNRRLGNLVTKRFIDPLVSGIYAGDVEKLSMKSCFPSLWQDEQHYGSLVKAAICRLFSKRNNKIVSLKRGLGSIISALQSKLQIHIRLSTPICRLELTTKAQLFFTDGKSQSFDKVISTLPASALATLLSPTLKLTQLLKQLPYASIAAINLGFSPSVLNKKGFGYLIPSSEKEPILGVVFDSAVFPDQNRTESESRLTVMVGGAHNPEFLSLNDLEVESLALKAVSSHLGISEKPKTILITRYPSAIPQYFVGHGVWLNEIANELKNFPSFSLLGNSFNGVAVNDCVKTAKQFSLS